MKQKKTFFAYLAFFLSFLFGCVQNEELANPLISNPAALDKILDDYIDNGAYPFLYARLEDKEGNLIYEHGKVNNDLHPGLTVNGDTWIRIWSMSKIVTISVALDLIEEGILSFEDPVTKFIPELKDRKVAVDYEGTTLALLDWDKREGACPFEVVNNDSVMTVLHLINHESGFYYATTNMPCLDSLLASINLPTARNTNEFIERLARMPLVQHPGTTDFYGINTTVLGMVAERATGKTLNELVIERLTRPLKIEGLQYDRPKHATLIPAVSGRDTVLRHAKPGELDIFGPDVPDYEADHQLYLGGEGMLATADGYTDFLRMLLAHGTLNDTRFLNTETVEDIYAPHTQLDNKYGYNGYNLWISGDSMRIKGQGDKGLWIGGGYEGTHFWVDPKREFVGVIMSQMSFAQPKAYGRDDAFRGEVYRQIFENEAKMAK
ncbi:MAG: CubicO group peptidase (beta-lactamase class C family) [Cyclobacteriaceae bacterium]|jgi:CubicO group peptidase (beta-lactamase class C family)